MESLYKYFIPTSFYSDEKLLDKRNQAVVIVSLSCFVILLGPIFALNEALRGSWKIAVLNIAVSPLFLAVPFLLRWTSSMQLTSNYLLGLLSSTILGLSIISGGFDSPYLISNIVLPTFAVFLAGIWVGIAWLLIVTIEHVVLYKLFLTKMMASIQIPVADPHSTRLFGLIILSIVGWSVAHLYERAKNQALNKLEESNKALIIAEQKAQDASLAKSAFLANMSHEIRTPLNAIIGYSEMIQEELDDLEPDELRSDLERVHKAGKHLLSLLNDILDLSKIEAGKMDLYLEPIKLDQIIQDVIMTAESLAAKNDNKLICKVDEDIRVILADQTKLRQTLLNLLSNACKFTEYGMVTLTIRMRQDEQDNPWIDFEVKDTGIGITDDQMLNLFQNFSQGDSSTTKKFGGTGLGLALSKKFCQMMGGDITVESVPQKGSIFIATLPHRTGTMLEHKANSSSDRLMASNAKKHTKAAHTVLVIDDEPDALDLLTRFLTKQGFNVVTSSSGKEGLQIARQIHPLVILLDVIMPGTNGWQILSQLKSDPEVCDIPVIMLSILDEEKKGYSLGASDYMTKPVNPERLLNVLARYRKDASQLSVMVVEDDPSTRDILQRTLVKNECKVFEAENGAVALDLLQTNTPSVIILDLMMPEVDGFTFLHEFRKKARFQNTPVIVLTAKELTTEERESLLGATQQIFEKGATELDTLLNEIHNQVNNYVQ